MHIFMCSEVLSPLSCCFFCLADDGLKYSSTTVNSQIVVVLLLNITGK